MPIDPQALLSLAERLVGQTPGADEADLRRGISTAYYALFHLLVKDAMSKFVTDPAFRAKVGRAFQHGAMKSVCDRYNPRPDSAGKCFIDKGKESEQSVAPDVKIVAEAFMVLHSAREAADYDDGATVQHTDAVTAVRQAKSAFQAWVTGQTDPSAVAFLQELLFRSIIKR